VFPAPKPPLPETEGQYLKLGTGHSSLIQFSVASSVAVKQQPPTSLETIFEDEPPLQQDEARSVRKQPIHPRSISSDAIPAPKDDPADDPAREHRGPIYSQTISHRDPATVAEAFESALIAMGVIYRKMSPLVFQMNAADTQATAEVCRLAGFRNIYVISVKRLKGDGLAYSRFVGEILRVFKPP
jgi:maternal embryonic leucine zipper kinase